MAAEPGATNFARSVFVVRPCTIGANPETRASNPFQEARTIAPEAVLAEFDGLVRALDDAGVRVVVGADTPSPPRPDAVFPNNWVSFHEEAVVLYPMLSPNRRREVRPELVEQVEAELGVVWPRRIDLTGEAERGRFLEGTGSLVLDRARRRALVGRSPRNHPELVRSWAQRLGFESLEFDTRGPDARPLYHTNVVVALGPHHAVWARSWVAEHDRAALAAWFEATDREALALDPGESRAFAANALALIGRDETPLWVLSRRAERALRPASRRRLEAHAALVVVPLDAIETLGGGSARCTLAEIFPPRATESLLGPSP
ncbi:MAG: arginine deiminase-related protein [Planctomycetota bacterium]